jgi:hypothetical protein
MFSQPIQTNNWVNHDSEIYIPVLTVQVPASPWSKGNPTENILNGRERQTTVFVTFCY